MALSKVRRSSSPLDQASLDALALRYVGKYATTRAKLRDYLSRKLRERGWNGDRAADLEGLVERFSSLGYIDDAAYAVSKSRALSGRGYGKRRLAQKLRSAGVEDDDCREAFEVADAAEVTAALRFAERRRIGPFASEPPDRPGRERAIAAMVRAGHGFGLARAIAGLKPGEDVDPINLGESSGVEDA